MADTVDRLVTIIALQGAARAITELRGLAQAAAAAAPPLAQLSQQTQMLAGSSAVLGKSFAGTTTNVLTAITVFRQLSSVVGQAMQINDQYNLSLTRTLQLYHDAGRAVSANSLIGMARGRQERLGIPESSTLDLAGQMAERGFSPGRIRTLLPALQEVEMGTGGRTSAISAMQMALRVMERPLGVGRGAGGGTRGLLPLSTQLGLRIQFTGDTETDLNRLTDAINLKFGGLIEAMAQTPSGARGRLIGAATKAEGRLGGLIESDLTPWMGKLTTGLNWFSRVVDFMRRGENGGDFRMGGRPVEHGFLGFWRHLTPAEEERRLKALGLQRKLDQQKDSDNLQRIAQSTQRMAQAIAISVFGNQSNFTRSAGAWRNLNQSMQGRG